MIVERPDLSYQSGDSRGSSDNRLIFGDNLPALQGLREEFTDRIRCIYIDPPFNTGHKFMHYKDRQDRKSYLTMMHVRLQAALPLMRQDGSLWLHCDDSEQAYLKVVMDKVFGEKNFVATLVWERRVSRENRSVFSLKHDYIHVYARDRRVFDQTRNPLPFTSGVMDRYWNPDNDPRGPWQSVNLQGQLGHSRPKQVYTLTLPNGRKIDPGPGSCWIYTEPKMQEEIAKGNVWFGRDGNGAPRLKKFLSENRSAGLTPESLWLAKDVGDNSSGRNHLRAIMDDISEDDTPEDGTDQVFESDHCREFLFDTPKPESLIKRVLDIATDPCDWVLDFFGGSGTTGTTAQKMDRQWVMVEIGDHCNTCIVPRLQTVIDGDDPGGITEEVGWDGGGGFRYFEVTK